MTEREFEIVKAALEAARDAIENTGIGISDPMVWAKADDALRAIDTASIVAGVPPRHKAERVMDELNHHALDEIERQGARIRELERSNSAYRTLQESIDKRMARQTFDEAALRTLDSEREANEILTARVAKLEDMLRRYEKEDAIKAAANTTLLAENARLCSRVTGLSAAADKVLILSARVAELEQDAARYRWLRDESKKNPDFYSGEPRWMVSRAQGGTGNNYFGAGIDAAIDAAMQEGE